MVYGVGTSVLSQQSSGSEPAGEPPAYETLSGAAVSNPYSPELKDIFFDTNSHLRRRRQSGPRRKCRGPEERAGHICCDRRFAIEKPSLRTSA
ncbi:MAG: hypothetical protein R3B51_11065 [Thermodesulfobacteriota bacterium]